MALVVCGAGFCGYWLIAGLAGARCARFGPGGPGRAAWWISAGCGGLAAAAVGDVHRVAPSILAAGWFAAAALAAWTAGTVLLVPVLAASITHLARQWRPPWGAPVWPPTFSTAVYALGGAQTGPITGLHTVTLIGGAAADVALALWLATGVLWLAHTTERPRTRVPGE